MSLVRVLLAHCIDYAGVFPPAGLDLPDAVDNFARYREGQDAWALGSLVIPARDLETFVRRWPAFATQWPLAVIVRSEADLRSTLHLHSSAQLQLAALEGALTGDLLQEAERTLPESTELFIEPASGQALSEAIAAIGQANAKAKLRTGGLTADCIPTSASVARFISCCVQNGVAFKATAGLHHALRGTYPLMPEHSGDRTRMHGFLNLLVASAWLHKSADLEAAIAILDETSFANLQVDENCLRWRDQTFTAHDLRHTRRQLLRSFGSCSFTEPLDELRLAGLLV